MISRDSRYVELSFYPFKSWQNLGIPVISSDKTVVLPARFNMELFKLLQTDVSPEVFTHRAVYDGRKIAFMVKKLPVNEKGSVEVCHPSVMVATTG